MLNSIQSTLPSPINFLPERGANAPTGRFAEALARQQSNLEGSPEEQAAQKAAEEFVSLTLVQPILTMLREQSTAAPPFAPGSGEKTFGPLLDAEIAKRITHAKGFGLVDVVARDLLKKHAPAPTPSAQETLSNAS